MRWECVNPLPHRFACSFSASCDSDWFPAGFRFVRFGSQADVCNATSHVRFTPSSDRESGFSQRQYPLNPDHFFQDVHLNVTLGVRCLG
jgi:hypothetical protein